ncbi:RNA polymerase sigma factor [Streptomyces lydicus]|uniref:RNA polymerase sigma factor n=1 Tax=Streptomyces lydicus TaxID=47763 RepID=UPI0037A7FBF9
MDCRSPAETRSVAAETQEVLDLLRSLPRQQRAVMAWTYDGFSPAEISQILGIPRATVDSHRRHARVRLKEILARRSSERAGGDRG